MIVYKYGKTSEVQVQNIEKSLNTIIEQFEEMKKDLVFLLREKRGSAELELYEYAFFAGKIQKMLTKNMQERSCQDGE